MIRKRIGILRAILLVAALILLPTVSRAQMYFSWQDTITNTIGQANPNATIIVLSGTISGAAQVNTTTQPGTPLATIYADPYGATPINQTTNPITTAAGNGWFQFWAAPGYYVIQAYGPGISGQYVYGISIGGGGGGGGGTIGGSIQTLQVPFGTGTNTIGGDSAFTWNDTYKLLSANVAGASCLPLFPCGFTIQNASVGLNFGIYGGFASINTGSFSLARPINITAPILGGFLGSAPIYGTTSGSWSIGVNPIAGSPCANLAPGSSPAANQFLSSAAPVAGSCQWAWQYNSLGVTNGYIPIGGATGFTNSGCDQGITTTNVLTCTQPQGASFQTQIVIPADNTHPSREALAGNTTLPALIANAYNYTGPPVVSYTAWHDQPAASTSGGPTTNNSVKLYPAASGIPLASDWIFGLVPVISGQIDQTGVSTANSGTPQNVLTSTPAAGNYRLYYYADQSAGCTTVGSGILSVTPNWTDGTHARAGATQTLTPGTADTGTGSWIDGGNTFWAASGSAITVTATYTACTTGTWTYDLHAYVEAIQ